MNPIQSLYRKQLNSVMASRQIQDLSRSAIFFAPHPDDETLGCGGTIIRKRAAGGQIKIVFMTDGSRSHAGLMAEKELKERRQKEASGAAQALGVEIEDITFLGFGDGRLTQFAKAAGKQVSDILTEAAPQEVFIPHRLDSQPDHMATHQIVMSALSELALQTKVYSYPVWYWRHWPWTGLRSRSKRETLSILKATVGRRLGTAVFGEFENSVYVGDVLGQKRRAIAQHATQMQRLQPNWPILSDVANGDFLDCFFQDYEIFHQVETPTAGGQAQ